MAIKRARKETEKQETPAAANAPAGDNSSSFAMLEMPPHEQGAGANHIQAPPPLPPGVYFSPTKEECLQFLNRSIAGDNELPNARGYIFHANVYGESPDVLRQRHPPASTRGGDSTWWFLSETRFQSQTGLSKRADRLVKTGGTWRMDQSKTRLDDDAGFKNCFGFYKGRTKKEKSPWLMQEFISANDDGTGKQGVPALYKVYVTPRATDEELRGIYGEDGVKMGPDGEKKPARAMVQEKYFDAIAALLPPGSVRDGVGQDHAALPQAPPPALPPPVAVAPAGLVDFYDQQGQYLGQYHQQEGQFFGQYHQQHGQYLGQYNHQQQHEQGAAQELFFGVAPPLHQPASPGLLNEVGADAPLDNLSMTMAELMEMINEQPALIANEEPVKMGEEQPAETVKEEEPNWGSLGNIVDDDVFASFNKEG